jgi:hypothetical protein
MTKGLKSLHGEAPCARTWEVEAAKDGRLSDTAKAALDRHIEQCVACRSESEYVEGLGRALREVDVAEIDDVALRRMRQRVLQRSDAEIAGRSIPPRKRGRTRLVMPAIAFASVLIAFLSWIGWKRTGVSSSTVVLATTTVDATGDDGTRWSKTTEGETERVDLTDGTLSLRVRKAPNGKRVIVRVPDGEIEDLGTVFHVVVRDGLTQRVGVDEGRVTIRLTHATPITISSGQTWERPQTTSLLPASATTMIPISASAPSAVAHRREASPQSTEKPPQSLAPPHAEEEDAAYLQALRLLREGHAAEAKTAAREYLRRFPDGFRREEMGRIAK